MRGASSPEVCTFHEPAIWTFVEQLQCVLQQQPMSGARPPDMLLVARELGLSARWLRRRLTEVDCSYRELTQAVLEARAKTLLREPELSLQAVAHTLGFGDPTAFHRAFKRRTGETPTQYREKVLGIGSRQR